MPAVTASAPGKIILFGEHAVVYGRPAIAVPVTQVKARAVVSAAPGSAAGQVLIEAPSIHQQAYLADLPADDPLKKALTLALEHLQISRPPACKVRIGSTIPVAAGLGSGAAVSVALLRAFSAFLGHPLPDDVVNALAFEVEKLHHGTPSGIDNTVITYARPVFFQRREGGNLIETFPSPQPFTVLVADTGVPSPTAAAVGDVRRAWQQDPPRYEALFDRAGELARAARKAIEAGKPHELGPLMDANHALLQEMGVSSPELERLVQAARTAGALGAKLSGGGRGGNMIALVEADQVEAVSQALLGVGAARAFMTRVEAQG